MLKKEFFFTKNNEKTKKIYFYFRLISLCFHITLLQKNNFAKRK